MLGPYVREYKRHVLRYRRYKLDLHNLDNNPDITLLLHLVFISNSRTQAAGSMSEGVWVGKKLEPLRELNSQSTRGSVPASPAGYSEQLLEEHHFAGEQKLTRRRATRRQEEEEEEEEVRFA